MSLRLSHLIKRTVKTTARPLFTPTANQKPSLTLHNNRLRRFAFYHRSVRKDDVAVIPANKVPHFARGRFTQVQSLWMTLRDGLSEDEYKDIAGQVEVRLTEAVAAAYVNRGAHYPQQQVSPDPASENSAASTAPLTPPVAQQEPGLEEARPALKIALIYKPPHPHFPGFEAAANIDVYIFSDEEDMLPVLVELRDADARIRSVFEQPEIFDA
ncbi:hypothetical protein KC320_g323 [Hortaea werneckii]|nr:hypothetical protein KC320_g323 [Hortaea werneckii]